MKLLGFLLMTFGLVVVAQAEVYRWVDADGEVHFGDRRRDNAEEVKIHSSAPAIAPPSQQERQEKARRLLHAWDEERRLAAEQKAEQKEAREERKRSCQRARNELLDLESGGRFYELDDQGERVYWDDARTEEGKQRWQDIIKRDCIS